MEKDRVFGLKCLDVLAIYDPSSQSLKMCQPSLNEGESKSLDHLPNQGMMLNGKLYLQNKLELDTSENEYGLWRTDQVRNPKLFPTPIASDSKDRGNMSNPSIKKRIKLGKQVSLSMCVSETSGSLNPNWVEWLMGYPIGYTELED